MHTEATILAYIETNKNGVSFSYKDYDKKILNALVKSGKVIKRKYSVRNYDYTSYRLT